MNWKKTANIFILALLVICLVQTQGQEDPQVADDPQNPQENPLDKKDEPTVGEPTNEDNSNEEIGDPSNTGNGSDEDNSNSDGDDNDGGDDNTGGNENPQEDDLGETNKDQDEEYQGMKSKELQVGDRFSVSKKMEANFSYQAVGFFHFHIKQKIPQKDLVFSVRGREDYSHNPLLFYSKTNRYPDMSHEKDISCGINGHDFCVIPSKSIEQDDIFYLGVFCMFSCKFEIAIQYDTVFNQMLNDQVRYESAKNDSYILDAKIIFPMDLDTSIQHVLIESFILNYDVVKSGFHMYVNKGTIPPTSSSYDYTTEELKLNGQSILLEKEQDAFTAGSIYSVSIEAPPQAHILLRSEGFDRERPLFFFKYAEDMVKKGKIRFFKLIISVFTQSDWNYEQISFDLEPYFGNPDLYINHNDLPEDPYNLDSYQWKSVEEDGMESLTISKNLINRSTLIGETFYVAVVGQTASSFRIMAYSSNLSQRELMFNCVENGYAANQDIIQYQFLLEQLTDSDITVKLQALVGEAHLFVKMCKNALTCEITMDDINSKSLGLPNFYRSEDHSKQHKIQFKFTASECINSSNVNVCKWVVGVLGSATVQTEYRLLGKHTSTPVQLRENEDHASALIEGDSEYYVFSLSQEDESITKVEFSITSISGEFFVYTSRKTSEPSSVDNEFADNANQDTITYHKNSHNPSLKGSYYLGVKAISGCVYQIHVKIYRKVDEHVTTIMKRVPLGGIEKGYVNYLEPVQYYFVVPENERSAVHQTNIVLYFNAYQTQIDPNIHIGPLLTVHYHINGTVLPVLLAQNPYVTQDFIYMKIQSNYTDAGKYVITLNHKDVVQKDYKIQYQLNVNAFNIIYIVPRSAYILDLDLGSSDNYEMYVNEPSKVYLEVFECFGKVKMQAASSINAIESKIYDVKSNSPPKFVGDHTIVNYERSSSGPLYLSVAAIQGIEVLNKIKALYMVIPHILPANQVIPHDVYSTPQEGQISTSVTFKIDDSFDMPISEVKVDFGAIECVNDCIDSIYQATQIKYIVHVTNNESLMQYYAKCNMNKESLQSLGFNTTNHIYEYSVLQVNGNSTLNNFTAYFSGLPNGTYYIEIMSVVFLETSYTKRIAEPFTFIYPMHQFVVGSTSNDSLLDKNPLNREEVFFFPQWIMIPLGLVLILLVIICIYKQVKTFIIRRNYRIAMESKDNDVEMANKQEDGQNNEEGQINDEDEKQGNKKADKLTILK